MDDPNPDLEAVARDVRRGLTQWRQGGPEAVFEDVGCNPEAWAALAGKLHAAFEARGSAPEPAPA